MWATRWIRQNMGTKRSLQYTRSRVIPKALFGAEISIKEYPGGAPFSSMGNKLARAAMGLEPQEGQKQPPNWCLLNEDEWVPWRWELSKRSDRLHLSLKRDGGKTLPGRLYAKGNIQALKKKVINFRSDSSRVERSGMAREWSKRMKLVEMAKMTKNMGEGSGTWWAQQMSKTGEDVELTHGMRRWRATMFPFEQLSRHKCPLCGEDKTNVHLAFECESPRIEEVKEEAFGILETVMNEATLHGLPEEWGRNWLNLPRKERLVILLKANVKAGEGFWVLISQTLEAMWKGIREKVEEKKEEEEEEARWTKVHSKAQGSKAQ
jgi:hypothetical protein